MSYIINRQVIPYRIYYHNGIIQTKIEIKNCGNHAIRLNENICEMLSNRYGLYIHSATCKYIKIIPILIDKRQVDCI